MDQSQESALDYPESFRQDLVERIARVVSRGESLLLYGPPGIGKTLFLQLLPKRPVKNTVFTTLNSDNFSVNNQTDTIKQIQGLSKIVGPQSQSRLVVIIDHVEKLAQDGFSDIRSSLKALRETARHRISFLFAADTNLKSSRLEAFGPLRPYLIENVVFLGPLNPREAEVFLGRMEEQFGTRLTSKAKQKVISQSGGVPRLIKRQVKLISDGLKLSAIFEDPSRDPLLVMELEKLAEFFQENPEVKFAVPLLDGFSNESSFSQEQIGPVHFHKALTKQEFALAKFLIENAGRICSREESIKAIWPKNLYETSEHALDQMVHRLRNKLETASPRCNLKTYRGRGCELETLS